MDKIRGGEDGRHFPVSTLMPGPEPNAEKEDRATVTAFEDTMETFYNDGWFKPVCRLFNAESEPERRIQQELVDSRSFLEHNDMRRAVAEIIVSTVTFAAMLIDNPALCAEFKEHIDDLARRYPDHVRSLFGLVTQWLQYPDIIRPISVMHPDEICEGENHLFKLMGTYTLRQILGSDFAKAAGVTKEQIIEAEKALVSFDIVDYIIKYHARRRNLPRYLYDYADSVGLGII